MVGITINIQDTLATTVEFIDTVLDDGFLPPGYSLEEVERIREGLNTCWKHLEDNGSA